MAAREDVHVHAGVAVDVVDTAEAADLVVAGAAREVVAGLAADDQVVARTAVRGEADGRERAGGRRAADREEPARVDHVVAGVEVRVAEREDPLVVLVLSVRDLRERVERLRPELVALRVGRNARVPGAVLRRVAVDDERRVRPGEDVADRDGADRDRVATDPEAAGLERVVAGHGQCHGRARRTVQTRQRRRQRRIGERERRRRQRRDRERPGETCDHDLHPELETGRDEVAAATEERAGRRGRAHGGLDADVHRRRRLCLLRLDHVDAQLRGTRGQRQLQRAGVEVDHAAEAATRERVGVRAGRVAEAGDRPRLRRAADLDVLRLTVGEERRVAVVGPGEPVLARDAVRADRHLEVGREWHVAAAVDDGQAAVRAGHGDGLRRAGRAREQRAAAELEHLADAGDVEQAPGAGDPVDHHELADLEAVRSPRAGRAGNGAAVRAARDRHRQRHGDWHVVGRDRANDGVDGLRRAGGARERRPVGEHERLRRVRDRLERPGAGDTVDRDLLADEEAVRDPVARGASQRSARRAADSGDAGNRLRQVDVERGRRDLGRRQHMPGEVHDRVVGRVAEEVVAEAAHRPGEAEAGDVDRLADEEALRLPVERERPADVDPGRGRREGDRPDQLDSDVRVERAEDLEGVVALAEQQVDNLDRALAAVRDELAVDERDGAVADPAREDRGLAEGLRVAARVGRAEVEVLGETETLDRRRRHRALAVLLAVVVEDVEDVDLLRLGRLRADREQRAVLLARELQAELERAVGAGDAALDRQRALELREHVGRDREVLDAGARDRLRVLEVGDEDDALVEVPVRVWAGIAVVEGGDRGEAVDPDVEQRAVGPREGVLGRELELVVLRQVVAADDRDLEAAADGQARGRADLDPLPLEEAVGEPAGGEKRVADVADQAAARRQRGAARRGRVDLRGDLAFPEALLGQAADGCAELRHGRADDRRGQRQHRVGHRLDVVVAVVAGSGAVDLDELAGLEALVDEAAEVAAVGAGERALAGRVVEAEVADEEARRDVAADRPQDRVGERAVVDRDAVDRLHVGEPVGEHGHLDDDRRLHVSEIVLRLGPLRQPEEVVVRVTDDRADAVAALDDERADAGLDRDDARGVVVDHGDGRQAGAGAEVRNRVVAARVERLGAVEIGVARVELELEDSCLGILGRGVVAADHADEHRRLPVRAREVDRVVARLEGRRGRIQVDPHREPVRADVERVGRVERQRLLALRVEHDLDPDRVADLRPLRELDQHLVVAAGVGAADGRVVRALDHEREPILDAGGERDAGAEADLGHVDAGRVVVVKVHLDVAHEGAVEDRVGGDDAVLQDDDAVALGARVVDRVQVDAVDAEVRAGRVRPVSGIELEHERAAVLVHEHPVDDLVPLELVRRIALARDPGTEAEPDRVGLPVRQRSRVEERVVGLLLRRARGRHRDVHPGGRSDREVDEVRVDLVDGRRAALAHRGAGPGLLDHDDAEILEREVVVDAVDRQAVVERILVGGDAMVDRAAEALELPGDDVGGDVAGDVDRVGAEAADDAVGDAERGRLDEELVVALETVDLDHLDVRIADVEAGAEDALAGDREVVGELGAEDDELVKAGAAVDRDRRVDVVLDLVLAAAGTDVERAVDREAEPDLRRGRAGDRVERDDVVLPLRVQRVVAGRLGVGVVADVVGVVVQPVDGRPRVLGNRAGAVVVRVGREVAGRLVGDDVDVVPVAACRGIRARVADRGEREGTDDEEVVVVVALEPELGLVRVHGELVVAGAAGGDERRVDARAEPAAGGSDQRREGVVRQQRALGAVALEPEDLSDLESVEAGAAVERRDRAVVVDVEGVVAAQAEDADAAVQRRVVADPLHARGRLVALDPVAVEPEPTVAAGVAVQQGDEGRPVGDLARRRAGRRHAQPERGDPVGALVVDALERAEQEDVVDRVPRRRAGDVAVVGRAQVVVTVDRELVDAVVLGAGVEHVDHVVADRAVAAVRVDAVVVGVGLAVEHEVVAGAVVEQPVCRAGDDVHRLEVVDEEDVLAVVARRREILAAADDRFRTEEDVARAPLRGLRARRNEIEAGAVAELERVDVRVAPDLRDPAGDRVVRRRCARAGGVATRGALDDDAVGDDPAAQDHVGAEAGIEVAVVAADGDAELGQDLAVLVGCDVVADEQRHVAALGEDLAAREDARRVDVVAARRARVALGEARAAVLDQVEVLVRVGARLAHGDPDVPVDGVREHEPQVRVGLGHVDVLSRLEPDIVVRVREARVGEAGVRVGAVRLVARRRRAA